MNGWTDINGWADINGWVFVCEGRRNRYCLEGYTIERMAGWLGRDGTVRSMDGRKNKRIDLTNACMHDMMTWMNDMDRET